jgi:uncharacterized OB-fold protein
MEHKLKFKDYNEALKQNKLLGLKCKQCGQISANPRIACAKCGSTDLEIIELKGKGKIQTFTSIFVAPEGRESECPYVVTLVELEEGPWIMGNLLGIDPKEATLDIIGKKVKMSSTGVFSGDKYSAGDIARPLFSLES